MKSYLLLFTSFCFLLLQSCKKENTEPAIQLKTTFKKDGIIEEMDIYHCTVKPNSSNPANSDFVLMARSKDFKKVFSIVIQVNGQFTTGSYQTIIGSGHYPVIADYFLNQGQPGERGYAVDQAPGMPPGQFSVEITSIEDKYIKGRFTGNYLYDNNNNEWIVISEGEFNAKLR